MNTEDTNTEDTWTVVVYGMGFWGCGNTYAEAVGNAPSGFDPMKDDHSLALFSEPVKDVYFGPYMYWTWVDRKGEVASTRLNRGLKEVVAAAND